MNVDLIKFVDDVGTITIYSTKDFWDFLYSTNHINKRIKQIYLVSIIGGDIINCPFGVVIEMYLNKPHISNVVI